jgi:hypothetical protein
MFTFTTMGRTVESYEVASAATDTLVASDLAHLPLWIAAATTADDEGYCEVYDRIASSVGGPTRDDLREAGLLVRGFRVRGTRTVTVSFDIDIPFELDEVEAGRPADIRDGDVDLNDLFSSDSITGETIRDAINRYAYFDAEVEGSYEVERVWTE